MTRKGSVAPCKNILLNLSGASRAVKDDTGQDLVEFALITALVAFAAMGLRILGANLFN